MYKLLLFDRYDEITDEMLERFLSAIPYARVERALKYRLRIDTINCAVSYLLMLYGLRNYFGITNPEVAYNEHGKPFITNYPNIYFNISHCKTGCICAISENDIGVDVQEVRPFSWDVAKRVCCDNEINELFTVFFDQQC